MKNLILLFLIFLAGCSDYDTLPSEDVMKEVYSECGKINSETEYVTFSVLKYVNDKSASWTNKAASWTMKITCKNGFVAYKNYKAEVVE